MRRDNISLFALIELMDDPDTRVYAQIRNELLSQGTSIIPYIEASLHEGVIDPEHYERLSEIIRDVQFKELKTELSDWIISSEKDLLQGIYLITKYQFPELSFETLKQKLWEIRKDIWLEINTQQTAFETIKTFNRVFFHHHDFRKSLPDEVTPFDIYIHSVIETGEGDSFSLGLVYSILAQSLDLPVFKIIQPNGNSILAYLDENQTLSHLNLTKECNGILFYINTDNLGSIIDSLSLQDQLNKLGLNSRKSFFEPSSNSAILKAYLRKIIDACRNTPNGADKILDLQEMLQLFEA
ncbi:MAG: transglutaminase family protein [Crocinitomicaceae bacterium]|nr:transglutaminase family protein [Crocinitomicaceae bacterium]